MYWLMRITLNVGQLFWQLALPPSFSTLSNASNSLFAIESERAVTMGVLATIAVRSASLFVISSFVHTSRYKSHFPTILSFSSSFAKITASDSTAVVSAASCALSAGRRLSFSTSLGTSAFSMPSSPSVICAFSGIPLYNHLSCGAYFLFNK